MLNVEAGGEPLLLLPAKAAYLPSTRSLLVADAHIGKAVSFRRLGVPVPRGTTSDTLSRLTVLVDALGAAEIVFLGDFLHSERAHAATTLATLYTWRERHASLRLTLVRGNHDDRAGDPPATLGFTVVDEPLRRGGLALCHHPRPVAGSYTLAGHLHPGIAIGRGFDRMRLPCFWFGREVAVLPAFGAFTGLMTVQPQPGDRLYAVADERLQAIVAGERA
jgi:DNA ligase-associated metallophosphoesterase